MTPDDEKFLRRAIELAAEARAAGEPAVRLAAGRPGRHVLPRTTTPSSPTPTSAPTRS